MRVLFDGFWWLRGPVSNRQVMREFVLAWEQEFAGDELIVAVQARDLQRARNELPSRVVLMPTRLRPQGVSAIVELPFVARRVRADVTVTHNFTPLFGPSAVFVHDLMFVTHPEWFTLRERSYYALMPLTLPRSRWILTSSASEAARISSLTKGRPVTPVGLAPPRGLAGSGQHPPELPLQGARVINSFMLAVGRLNARKNLAAVIEAAIRSGRASPASPLLIVGEPGGMRATLSAEAEAAVASGAVVFLGFVDDAQLAWLYARASVFVFLSLDEGFGMPTLEALSFGAPVVASDIAVFREILGERARFAPPHDVEAAAAAIREAYDAGRFPPVDVDELGYSWRQSVVRMRGAVSDAADAPQARESTARESPGAL